MGAPKVKVPGPSPEERDLQRQQAEMLKLQRSIIEQQQSQNKVLLPFLAEREGFDVTVDANGNITGISERADDIRATNKEIEQLQGQRTLAALKGELPVDPGLERDLAAQRAQLTSTLTQQFGPGGLTSTPAQEALQRFNESENILREGARTQQLTLAEQLGIARQQENIFSKQSSQDVLLNQATGLPLTLAGAFGQTARGFGAAQQPFIQQRQMQLQASIANAQSQTSLLGAGIGAIGGLFGLFSDEDMKGDLVPIGTTEGGLTIYEYTRKDTGERMIGVLSREAEEKYPWAIGVRGGYETVDYREL